MKRGGGGSEGGGKGGWGRRDVGEGCLTSGSTLGRRLVFSFLNCLTKPRARVSGAALIKNGNTDGSLSCDI